VITGVRALLQKLGPGALTAEPICVKPETSSTPTSCSSGS
jgi:hypothetical protein